MRWVAAMVLVGCGSCVSADKTYLPDGNVAWQISGSRGSSNAIRLRVRNKAHEVCGGPYVVLQHLNGDESVIIECGAPNLSRQAMEQNPPRTPEAMSCYRECLSIYNQCEGRVGIFRRGDCDDQRDECTNTCPGASETRGATSP